MMKLKSFLAKHREVIAYFGYGSLTTVVNFAAFWLMELVQGEYENAYLVSNAVAWLAAVIFAYVTNKLFVFRSRSWKGSALLKEIAEFAGARVLSFVIEEFGLIAMVDWMGMDAISWNLLGTQITGSLIAKLLLAVIVVTMNYFFSKFVIFKKKT